MRQSAGFRNSTHAMFLALSVRFWRETDGKCLNSYGVLIHSIAIQESSVNIRFPLPLCVRVMQFLLIQSVIQEEGIHDTNIINVNVCENGCLLQFYAKTTEHIYMKLFLL